MRKEGAVFVTDALGYPCQNQISHGVMTTTMHCEEYSVVAGHDMFLCNSTTISVGGENKTWKVCLCHVEYHKLKFNNK